VSLNHSAINSHSSAIFCLVGANWGGPDLLIRADSETLSVARAYSGRGVGLNRVRISLQDLSALKGLHHVTAIASDPQRNLDFYVGLLGLRFVKRAVRAFPRR